jgi:hypothetical protein
MLKVILNENNSPSSKPNFKIDDSKPVKRKTRKTKSLFSNYDKQRINEYLNANMIEKKRENILNETFINSKFYFRF